ncbi:hypothetical protein GCG21_01100 [Pseudactinotalea sp. HY160]|uniref:BTAD domain-containing putative transcriptional regulator n=1 Tax=Pseudactinotalea sp. HY160 TaxID=2654490 RepID=UPI00128E8247|nr:BTAD domain-containing putative transcriptional regulator [Pseudactinotalea sp. HY160]MPV48629.1 hypothetical protein [Pseudactinotalea sp. HY160]
MTASEVPAARPEPDSFALGDPVPPAQPGMSPPTNPVPASVVGLRREQLLRRLDPVARDHLGLLVAPAGSGKTTLMAQWAESAAMPVAWCRLDVSAATGRLLDWLWQALGAHVRPNGAAPADVAELARLLRDHPGRLLLVIDDLHAIAESAMTAELERFILLAPPNIRFLLGSRVFPRVNMARSELPPVVLLTGDDLRFRTWEVEKLFQQVHRAPLPPHDVAALTRYTQGWAAALQLFHLATVGHQHVDRRRAVEALAARPRYAQRYLSEQVLATLPAATQEFLVRTSVFDVLTARRCDLLLGITDSQRILRDLTDRQAFTTTLDGGVTFHYHDVLRRHLETMLREELGAEATHAWYRMVADLLEAERANVEALRARARGEDWEGVRELLRHDGHRIVGGTEAGGGPSTWAPLLPRWLTEADPWCGVAEARRLYNDGRLAAADLEARRAREAFTQDVGRRICDRIIADVAAWRDPTATPSPNPTWGHLLRAAVRRDPLAAARAAREVDGPAGRLVEGLALAFAGRCIDATAVLSALVAAADPEAPSGHAASLALVTIRALLRGPDESTASRFDDIAADTGRLGLTWLARLATGLSLALGQSRTRRDLVALVAEHEARGDRGAGALIAMVTLLSQCRHDRGRAGDLLDLGQRLRSMDAATLAVWCESIGALMAASQGLPDADRLARGAEDAVRHAAVPGAAPFAYAALRHADPARRDDYLALARGAAIDVDLGLRPWEWFAPHEPPPTPFTPPEPPEPPGPPGPPGQTRGASTATGSRQGEHDAGPRVRMSCFGGFAFAVDGRAGDLSRLRPRARALLKFLGIHAGRQVHRDAIADALWGDLDSDSAMRNFQVSLSTLRSAIEPGVPGRASRIIQRTGEAYRLNLAPGSHVDVREFEAALNEAKVARLARDAQEELTQLAHAVELYRGDLFPEEGAAEWVQEHRERLRASAAEAASELARLHFDATRWSAAVATAQRSIDIDHYRDDAWRLQVAALRRAGEPAAAERAARAYRDMLGELGVHEVIDL